MLALEIFRDLSNCSCNSWEIAIDLSCAVSIVSALIGSLSIRSIAWVWAVDLLNKTVSVDRGAVTKVTVPELLPTPETA